MLVPEVKLLYDSSPTSQRVCKQPESHCCFNPLFNIGVFLVQFNTFDDRDMKYSINILHLYSMKSLDDVVDSESCSI